MSTIPGAIHIPFYYWLSIFTVPSSEFSFEAVIRSKKGAAYANNRTEDTFPLHATQFVAWGAYASCENLLSKNTKRKDCKDNYCNGYRLPQILDDQHSGFLEVRYFSNDVP